MDNLKEEIVYKLILHSGNAKVNAMLAIESAEKSNFDESYRLLKMAYDDLKKAHEVQTQLIYSEANGEILAPDILLVHAQDHLTMATMCIDNCEIFLKLYLKISEIKKGDEIKIGKHG